MLNQDPRARRQALPRATLRRSLGFRGENCAGRRLDSTTKQKVDSASTGGKRRIELSLDGTFLLSDKNRKLRGSFCFFGRGRRGTD